MRSLPPDSSFGTCPAMVRWAAGPVLYIIRLQKSVSESGGVGNRQNQPNRRLVVGCCKQPSIMAQSQIIAQAYAPGAPTARNTGVSPARDGSFKIASLNLSGWQQTETHCTGTHRRLPSINTAPGRCPNDEQCAALPGCAERGRAQRHLGGSRLLPWRSGRSSAG